MPIMKRTAILLNIMAIFWYLNFPPLNFSQLLFSLLQGCMTGQKETKYSYFEESKNKFSNESYYCDKYEYILLIIFTNFFKLK